MPNIKSDVVDGYIFRRVNARIQFLVLRRKPDLAMGDTWQSIHAKIATGESALVAATREVASATGLSAECIYSSDYVNQFFDYNADTIVLAPTFAFKVAARSKPSLSEQYGDYAWCDLEETTARLPLNSQRWAVRHIYDVIAHGGEESEIYQVRTPNAAFGRGNSV